MQLEAMLLWLWHRLAAAAPVRPLAWELPYALNREKKKRIMKYLVTGTYLIFGLRKAFFQTDTMAASIQIYRKVVMVLSTRKILMEKILQFHV